MIKALVGDDLIESEMKYGPKFRMRGNFNIVVTSNKGQIPACHQGGNRAPDEEDRGMNTSSYEIRVQRLNETPDAPRIETPEETVRYWETVITKMPWYIPDREVCVSITVNGRLRATGHTLVSIGTLNETVVAARDVFRAAVAMAAFNVILVHNHPSGDASPSNNDNLITRRIAECGVILQIKLMDHVIVGAHGARFSFKEKGLL